MRTFENTKLRSALLMLCLLTFGFAGAQTMASVEGSAVVSFEEDVIDYGTMNQNDDGLRTFYFKNEGQIPLIISKVKTSCGCTVPTYSKEAIKPGETGTIEIKYNTKKVGAFNKTITVYSNAAEAKKTLKIKGTVVAVN
ncbi:MAG: DUF1573 domain-containing protein [Bacteroidota bacterium]